MKYSFLFLFSLIFYFSCTKSTDTNNPPPTDSTQDKRVISTTENGSVYSQFTYDQDNQLASMLTRITAYPGLDTFLMTFNLSGTNNPPASYDYTWYRVTNSTNAVEHHVLVYDDQKRLVLDSLEYGTTTSNAYVYLINTKYIYSAGNIVAQHYTNNYGTNPPIIGPSILSTDSIYLSNGNLTQDVIYYLGGDTPAVYSRNYYTPTTYKNPLYQENLSNSLGMLLCHNSGLDYFLGDFISPNYSSPWGNTNNLYTVNYTTDSTGYITRVAQDNIAGGYLMNDVIFQYQ